MSLEGIQLGQYRLLQLIGSGGMGEVYLAEDARINQQVAIKVSRTEASPYPNASSASESARLFQREARAIAQLDHPRILPLYGYGEEQVRGETLTYIVMPYRKEGSLVTWLRQRTNASMLNPQDVAAIVTQAAEALQYAHDHNVIHQDVKPANFLVRNRNDASATVPDLLLTDFGIAKLSSATSHSSHAVRGTATYMAPEQWSGDPVPATDQYALAVMAYELLTGRLPFQGRLEQLMYAHVNTPPLPPSAFNSRLSGDIDRVLLHALAKNPEQRFRSIAAFAYAFQQAVQRENAPTILRSSSSGPISGTVAANIAPNYSVFPGNVNPVQSASNPITSPPYYAATQIPVKQQVRPNGKYFIGVGLVLLLILGGLGAYFVRQINNPPASPGTNSTNTGSTQGARATVTDKNPYSPFTGTLALNDPLHDNSRGNNWDTNPTPFGTCNFTGNGYDVAAPIIKTYHRCMAEKTDFSNFAYQVDMTITAGDCGAIIFRGNTTNYQYYYFHICQDGSYALWLYTHSGYESKIFISGSSPNVHSGLNVIAVVANNTAISMYINHQFVTTIQDSTYSHGQIGVAVDSNNNSTEVVFSNAKVWTL
ncbi:MAG TPA: serine/threonine-protein kinase [Ktedonobacteraceae bacterium]|nr:serine/threonine-protein kinase [Ktedonobacteraceae bacterium]